jgi:aminoglycoside/choline kinase family phosphotransferase
MSQRQTDGSDERARIEGYLQRSGLAARGARVVPLTGDASDRRYFRVLLQDEPAQVLAVHPGPIDFDALPFVNVAKLLSEMPVPVPRILGHSDELGIIALQDLGDVTLQAHLGAASPAQHAALYRQAVSFIDTLQRRGAEMATAVLHEAFPRSVSGRATQRRRARRACRRIRGDCGGACIRTARALSSRLPQP